VVRLGEPVRVALARCADYAREEVREAVRRALTAVGGPGDGIRPGTRVLLKANLLSPRPPGRAVTTHPAVVAAVTAVLRGFGADVWVGDSSGGAVLGQSLTAAALEVSGVARAAREAGARVLNFDQEGVVAVPNRGHTRDVFPVFYLSRPVAEADLVVNLPKLKTHSLTVLTGAVKNVLGCLPGLQKADCHRVAPRVEELAALLCDLYRTVRPALTLMDAVVAMEGNGPGAGRPRHVGALLAGHDGVAVDTVAAMLVGLHPQVVPTTAAAAAMGTGTARYEDVVPVGDHLEELKVRGFRLPTGMFLRALTGRLPRPLVRWALELGRVSPVIDAERCTACGLCRASCPVGAITPETGPPRVNKYCCVGCLCCHELCPEQAVTLRYDHRLAALLLGGVTDGRRGARV